MVNIRKRGKVYQYQFEIAKVEGKRKYISKSGFKTRNEALMAGMKAYDEYLNGGVTKDSQMSYELEPIKNEYGKINEYKIVEGKLYHIIIRTFYFFEEIFNFYTKLGNEKLASIFKDIKDKLLKGIMSVESLYIQENIDINDI